MDKSIEFVNNGNELKSSRHLIKQLLVKLGNPTPTETQIKLADSLIMLTTINHQMVFHQALTEREISCLLLAAKGSTMQETANILNVKYSTIETWYKKIKRKLGCSSIAQAVFEGIRYGYMRQNNDQLEKEIVVMENKQKNIFENIKVLLVEDNEVHIKVAKSFLRKCGITEVTVARTGQSALELFSPELNLVILDVGLPDISGLEVCRLMRNQLKENSMPIVAWTIKFRSQDACLEAGMNYYMEKPTPLGVFKKVISLILGLDAKAPIQRSA